MRIHRLPVACLAALLSVSAFADALSAPRPLLPRGGVTPVVELSPRATDGTNFLFFTRTQSAGRFQTVVIAPDGTQLSTAVSVPTGFNNAVWAGNYFVYSNQAFLRITADGARIDRAPRPMPESGNISFSASNGRHLLVHYVMSRRAYLIGPDGVATSIGVLPDSIAAITGNDGHFLISYRPAGPTSMRLRLLDGRGQIVRDEEARPGISPITNSDGLTWLAHGTIDSFVLDNEFRTVASFLRGGSSLRSVIPGHGYLFGRIQRSLGTAGELIFTELRAPTYKLEGAYLPLRSSNDNGPGVVGNAHTLLVLNPRIFNEPAMIGRIASIDQITRPYPSFTATLQSDRHIRAAKTNAKGVTLLVWSETGNQLDHGNLYAARIAASGELLDGAPQLLTPTECLTVMANITTNGDDFLVGWLGCYNVGADLITGGTRVPVFRNISKQDSNSAVAVHFDGDSYLLIWHTTNRAHLVELLPNGTSLGPTTQHEPSFINTSVAARRGGGYLALWYRSNIRWVGPLSNRLRIEVDGTQLPLASGATILAFEPVGDRFLLAGRSEQDLRVMWLDANTNVLGPIPAATTSLLGMTMPRIVCDTTCMLLWTEQSFTAPRVLAKEITLGPNNTVTVGAPVLLHIFNDRAIGNRFHLHGTPDAPRLLIVDAEDPETGGQQIYVQTPPKRRAARR